MRSNVLPKMHYHLIAIATCAFLTACEKREDASPSAKEPDSENSELQASESEDPANNLAMTPGGLPDLVIVDAKISEVEDESRGGRTIPLIYYDVTIRNIGDGVANLEGKSDSRKDNLKIDPFFSSDRTWDDGDISGHGVALPDPGILSPGSELGGSFVASTSRLKDPVNYLDAYPYLIIKIRPGDVEEIDESNNTIVLDLRSP